MTGFKAVCEFVKSSNAPGGNRTPISRTGILRAIHYTTGATTT